MYLCFQFFCIHKYENPHIYTKKTIYMYKTDWYFLQIRDILNMYLSSYILYHYYSILDIFINEKKKHLESVSLRKKLYPSFNLMLLHSIVTVKFRITNQSNMERVGMGGGSLRAYFLPSLRKCSICSSHAKGKSNYHEITLIKSQRIDLP